MTDETLDILDVLVYLLKNYMHENCELPEQPNALSEILLQEGFEENAIRFALDWVIRLVELSKETYGKAHADSIRLLVPYERERLSEGAQRLIAGLLKKKLITSEEYELIIELGLNLGAKTILSEAHMRIVSMLVLFHSPRPEARGALAQMEKDILLKEGVMGVH